MRPLVKFAQLLSLIIRSKRLFSEMPYLMYKINLQDLNALTWSIVLMYIIKDLPMAAGVSLIIL